MENTIVRFGADEKRKFLNRTYLWMSLALLISAASAFFTASSPALVKYLFSGKSIGFLVLAIGEIALVWWLSASIQKISVGAAYAAFVLYSVVNGMTLSSIFFVYSIGSIAYCFAASAAMFLGMAIYGACTKKNLNTFGRYLMMALVGLIFASIINLVVSMIAHQNFTMFDWIISFATIIIFTGLTAYDSQKIIKTAEHSTGSDDYKKIAVLGALELYLDFINIFLSMLRLFGRRK